MVPVPSPRRTTTRSSLLLVALFVLVAVIGLNGRCSYAKGVRSAPPRDEYLASFFDPSSTGSETAPDGVTVERDVEQERKVVSHHCACETQRASTITPSYADHGAQDDGIREMEEKLVAMETRLTDVERTSNRLKKLAMAAMSVALADEGEGCSEAEGLGLQQLIKGFPALTIASPAPISLDYCEDLGTITKPATSCNHIKLACNDKQSGTYFVNNGYFTQVYCEMTLFGGGWTRYGKAGMQSQWNFVDEDLIEVKLQIVETSDIKEMIDMDFNTFRIHTDVSFRLQADDSTNPSRIQARTLPWFHRAAYYIDGYGENFTLLEFLPGADRITCRITPDTSHKCGWGLVPRPDQASDQVLIESLYFGPRATGNGARTYQGHWERNRYTWSGSYYYVYAK